MASPAKWVLGPAFSPSPYLPEKFPATRNPSSRVPFNPENTATQVWPVTLLHKKQSSDHFKVSLLSPVAQVMQKVDTSKTLFCSECVHSNSDVCCLKDLLNYCGYILPLQTIKTTSNPEKDKISPLVVIEEKAPSLFP